MSMEARAIVAKASARIGKDVTLERFESNGTMVVGVGEKKAVTQINDISGAMERVFKHVRQFEVETKIPMDQNPNFDRVPDPTDPNRSNKVHWADIPNEQKGVDVLCDAIAKMQEEYDALLAQHQAAKAEPIVKKPASELDDLKARADDLGIDYKGTWGVKKFTEAIAEAEALMAKSSGDDFLDQPVSSGTVTEAA